MENGILVKPREPKALGDAMLALIQDKHLGRRLGINGFKEVRTWDEIASESIKLYNN